MAVEIFTASQWRAAQSPLEVLLMGLSARREHVAAVNQVRSKANCSATPTETELVAELAVLLHWLARSAAAASPQCRWPCSPTSFLALNLWQQAPFYPLLHLDPLDGTISSLRRSTYKLVDHSEDHEVAASPNPSQISCRNVAGGPISSNCRSKDDILPTQRSNASRERTSAILSKDQLLDHWHEECASSNRSALFLIQRAVCVDAQ